jgi:hypothetical protein
MTPEERQLLTALVDRIKNAPPQTQKDAEAEAMISAMVQARPDAPYLLAQTVLIQDFSLDTAKAQIADLQRQLAEAKSGQGASQGSFLGGAVGRGSVPETGPAPSPWRRLASQSAGYAQPGYQAPPYQPPPYQPAGQPIPGAPMMQPSQTSSFLRDAATTAAGVAGGALLFQGISSMFGGGHYGGFGGSGFGGAGFGPSFGQQPSITEITNNYYGNEPSPSPADPGPAAQPASADDQYVPDDQAYTQDADYTTDDSDTDFGGGDDYA